MVLKNSSKNNLIAVGAAVISGGGALAATALGQVVAGVILFAAGSFAAFYLSSKETGEAQPESIKGFLDIYPANEDNSNPIADQLRDLLGKIDAHGEAMRNVVRYLQEHAMLVGWLIGNFDQAAKDATRLIEEIRNNSGEVIDRGGKVLEGSKRGAELVSNIEVSAKTLAADADSMSVSAKSAESAVTELQSAFVRAEMALRKLAEVSDHSTKFISDLGQTMGGIRETTQQSLELFGDVEAYTKRGREVVGQVGKGVEEIKRSTEAAMEGISELSIQSRQIEDVLEIINDVADETSLLALNAAILAAQAGERGAAFAVVASQIRSLAHRTRESIEHIESIVRSVQKKIKETNQRMEVSVEAVNQGQSRGQEAVLQLDLIERAVLEAVDKARSVAQAVEHQDDMSARMVSMSTEMNMELHDVASVLRQSSSEMEDMGVLVKKVTVLSGSVRAAAESNHQSALFVGDLMDRFVDEMGQVESLIVGQTEKVGTLDEAMGNVESSAEATRESLTSINDIVTNLVHHADELREEVRNCGVEVVNEDHTATNGSNAFKEGEIESKDD